MFENGGFTTGFANLTKACAMPVPDDRTLQLFNQTIIRQGQRSLSSLPELPKIPRSGVYTLHLNRKPGEELRPLKIFALGCQGGGQQKIVAELLCQRIREEGPPDLIFLLGDNGYPSGMKSIDDSAFRDVFEDMYPTYPELKDIPFFVILGNHDYCCSKFSKIKDRDEKFAYWQVLYTYLDLTASEEQKKKLDPRIFSERQQFFQQARQPGNELSLADPHVRGWLMPHFYYRLNVGSVVFLCVDSNTLARDYYRYQKNVDLKGSEGGSVINAQNNQYCWLMHQTSTLAGKTVVIAIHQGTKTAGKRALPKYYDTYQYLTLEQCEFFYNAMKKGGRVNSISSGGDPHYDKPSHNKIIKFILKQLGLDEAILMCAHDHHMAYGDILTLGGGGGTPQSFFSAKQVKKRILCLKEYGFGEICFPQREIFLQPSSSSDSTPAQSELTPIVTFHTKEARYTYKFGHRIPLWEDDDDEEEKGLADEFECYIKSVRRACYEFLEIKDLSKDDIALVCAVLALLQRNNVNDCRREALNLWKNNQVLSDLIAQQLGSSSVLEIGRSRTPIQEKSFLSSSSSNMTDSHPASPSRRDDIEEESGVSEEFIAFTSSRFTK